LQLLPAPFQDAATIALEALSAHPKDLRVVDKAMHTLWYLYYRAGDDVGLPFRARLLTAAHSAIASFPDDYDVRDACLGALNCLVVTPGLRVEAVAAAQDVMTVMRLRRGGSGASVRVGMSFLCWLSRSEDSAQALVREPGVVDLVREVASEWVGTYQDPATVTDLTTWAQEIQDSLAAAVSRLAAAPANAEAIIAAASPEGHGAHASLLPAVSGSPEVHARDRAPDVVGPLEGSGLLVGNHPEAMAATAGVVGVLHARVGDVSSESSGFLQQLQPQPLQVGGCDGSAEEGREGDSVVAHTPSGSHGVLIAV
jgi:hypothetical protein